MFKKGQSGNPHGRPRTGNTIAEHIRKLGGVDGKLYVAQLHAIATGEHSDVNARIKAIEVLLNRGFGKPTELHEHSGVDGEAINIHHHYAADAAAGR